MQLDVPGTRFISMLFTDMQDGRIVPIIVVAIPTSISLCSRWLLPVSKELRCIRMNRQSVGAEDKCDARDFHRRATYSN